MKFNLFRRKGKENDNIENPESPKNLNSIDKAISYCDYLSNSHNSKSKVWFIVIVFLLVSFIVSFFIVQQIDKKNNELISQTIENFNYVIPKIELAIDKINQKLEDNVLVSLRDTSKYSTELLCEYISYYIITTLRTDIRNSWRNRDFKELKVINSPLYLDKKSDIVYINEITMRKVIEYSILDLIRGDIRLYDNYKFDLENFKKHMESNQSYFSQNFVYIMYAVLVLLLGIAVSFYRYHLKETTRNQNNSLGFQRIRVSGNNDQFNEYAKYFLSKDAFNFSGTSSKEKYESPFPGNTTSDLSTFALNFLNDHLKTIKEEKNKDEEND